ncbi:MAG: hypothetical protein CL596_06570 [Alteromonas sp.]|nr:hypothetical protein [Alteromonas sp.]MAY21812.1 hypothetical protein [Flavobacteriaceae bacterium]|tara:strand:- start:33938 stop:35101 length:1164 start_codon:yes stop_codon:yes gene_type:complete
MISTEELVDTYPNLYKIDRELHKLVQKIEMLNYINPTNIEQEKRNFFASKYNVNPNFKYKRIDFNAHKLQQALFSQDIDTIQDEETRKFYREVIYDYSGLIQCIESIGKGEKFYFNVLKSFGTPTEKDVQNAQFILHFKDEKFNQEMFPVFNVDEALAYFQEFAKKFDFQYNVKISNKISAAAMVQNNTQTLFLKKNHRFSANQLKVLANHEIGVHMVTTFNGINQPLKIFYNGFPKNVETQEGLAVFSEYMSGCLTLYRLKELAYRVLAADSLRKGFNFCDTFDLLHNQYKLNREESYNISLRAHRGGGFTKDYTYLTGLKKVYTYYKRQKDLNTLLTGKVNIGNADLINTWKEKGIIGDNPHRNFAFDTNNNESETIDFILENLK